MEYLGHPFTKKLFVNYLGLNFTGHPVFSLLAVNILPPHYVYLRWWKKPMWPPTTANPGSSWCWPPSWTSASICWQSCPSWSCWCLSRTSSCCPSSQRWPASPRWGAWLWSLSISFRSVPEATAGGGCETPGEDEYHCGRWRWGRRPALSSLCQRDIFEHFCPTSCKS